MHTSRHLIVVPKCIRIFVSLLKFFGSVFDKLNKIVKWLCICLNSSKKPLLTHFASSIIFSTRNNNQDFIDLHISWTTNFLHFFFSRFIMATQISMKLEPVYNWNWVIIDKIIHWGYLLHQKCIMLEFWKNEYFVITFTNQIINWLLNRFSSRRLLSTQ